MSYYYYNYITIVTVTINRVCRGPFNFKAFLVKMKRNIPIPDCSTILLSLAVLSVSKEIIYE